MYKVKIDCELRNNNEYIFQTELPKIPNIGEQIGFWHDGVWVIANVKSIVYELDEQKDFLITEITIIE